MTTSETRAVERRGRSRGWRAAAALMVVIATLAALALPASGWIRARSDISRDAEAERICTSGITLSATLDHQVDSFDFSFPTFVGVPDVTPYPGVFSSDFIDLYASAADALANTNEVVTVEVPQIFRSVDSSAYRFSGEATVPTPAGFDNGDVLYASAFDSTLSPIAVPLTIGDPIYDCPPEDLPWGILPGKDRKVNEVRVNAFLPHSFVFDASSVDPKTLTVRADGSGPAAVVVYLGSIGDIGVARVNLNDTGLDCGTESLRLAGTDAGGYAYQDDIEVYAMGRSCPS